MKKKVVVELEKSAKKKIEFKNKEDVEVNFNEQVITVTPVINAGIQSVLIEKYLENYFEPKGNSVPLCPSAFVDCEGELKIDLLQNLTNIDLQGVDFITLLASGIFEKVISVVSNYGEFKAFLYQSIKIIEKQKELDRSVGGVVQGLAVKISEFMDKLNSLSPEEIKLAGEQGSKLLKEIEESPASSLFIEANKAQKV